MRNILQSFDGFQYVFDHPRCCNILCEKLTSSTVKGRLILDRNQFFNCPCARQPQRLRELMNAGAQIRVFKPDKGGYSSMHAKTWLFDGEVVITGSPNTTENGLTNNEEELWKLQLPQCAQFVRDHFEKVWNGSLPVTGEDVENAEEKVQWRRSRSRSASHTRLSRSLSKSQTARRLSMGRDGNEENGE